MSQTSCCEPSAVREEKAHTVTSTPRADGWETAEAYVLSVEMPGVDDAHVDVTLEKNVLTISGTADASRYEGLTPVGRPVMTRRYERSFRLPEGIDATQLDATVQNGVLTLRMPKSQQALRRKISVRPA
jgi:HSP20 family protein